MAQALAAAHRKGVCHRDLKPGNVMLTKTGAKLLDFGLAKVGSAVAAQGPGVSLSMLPTHAVDLTQKGTVLGTVQYMSPEQLQGKDADARSDIFAFGAVLYEMTTGRKAFEGKSVASVFCSHPRFRADAHRDAAAGEPSAARPARSQVPGEGP
jgi:serine/threonine protein kinase